MRPTADDDQGSLIMVPAAFIERLSRGTNSPLMPEYPVVGRGGILNYLSGLVEKLETGVFGPGRYRELSVFPQQGETASCCVTKGIEVKASAQWLPSYDHQERLGLNFSNSVQLGLNFSYSVQISRVEEGDGDDSAYEYCQLLSRHWEFMDGNGSVHVVDGDAVIGKQPVFFRRGNKPCFKDLGPAGDGVTYSDTVFRYVSQTGPVAGTSQDDTKCASVKGSFRFVPGTIDNPTGPQFDVFVAKFPLAVSVPFY